jgi:hypothetical protein
LLALACLALGPSAAQADISALLYDACSNAVTTGSPAFDPLGDAGWSELQIIDDHTHALLASGILASMATDRDTPMEWESARPAAQEVAETLLEVVEIRGAKGFAFGAPATAVLVVSNLPSRDGYKILHCVAAGDLGDDLTGFVDQLRAADKTAGATQATPGLEMFSIRAQSRTETDPPRIIATDATLGLFDTSNTEAFPAPPATRAGLSLYRYTQE